MAKDKQQKSSKPPSQGKGSRPRSGYNQKYRDNWEEIFRKGKKEDTQNQEVILEDDGLCHAYREYKETMGLDCTRPRGHTGNHGRVEDFREEKHK